LKNLQLNLDKVKLIENCQKAVKMSLESNEKNILVTGSIYFVGEYLKYLKPLKL